MHNAENNGKKWKKAESSGSTESTEAPIVYSGGTGRDGVDTGKNAVVKDTTIWGFVGIGIPVAGLIAAAIFMFLKIRKLEELLFGYKVEKRDMIDFPLPSFICHNLSQENIKKTMV